MRLLSIEEKVETGILGSWNHIESHTAAQLAALKCSKTMEYMNLAGKLIRISTSTSLYLYSKIITLKIVLRLS